MTLGACMLAVGLLCSAQVASATIIVDTPVELTNTDWVNPNANPWFSDGGASGGFDGLSANLAVNQGVTAIHSSNVLPTFTNADVSGGSETLQQGTYTISFAVGAFVQDFNYSDADGNPTVDLIFAGMLGTEASSSSTPEPANPGDWQLWSYTWNVSATNPNLTNVLNFSLTGFDGGLGDGVNAGFDGVGALSADGSGFLVDFVPIPEPSTLALGLVFGLAGLLGRRRS